LEMVNLIAMIACRLLVAGRQLAAKQIDGGGRAVLWNIAQPLRRLMSAFTDFHDGRSPARIGAATAVACSLLTGCTADLMSAWTDRYGPSPAIDLADLRDSTSAHNQIMLLLAQRAGLASVTPDERIISQINNPVNDPLWYNVMIAGFDYVDEKCDAYM